MSKPALPEVTDFILSQAQQRDIDAIIEACKQRRRALRDIQAAAISVGDEVTVDRLSPAYLNGLSGTVIQIDKKWCTLRLDTASTDQLRSEPKNKRFPVPREATAYELAGIPLSACVTK
jgi:hypothetical protein